MRHLDLFSGIGGFALAVDTVWPGSEHIFCDNDLFCQQVLKKHWPNSKIYGDIRQIITDTEREGKQQPQGREPQERRWLSDRPFILTGGFPCQPFSQAGRRKGTEDNRYLWPEMFRVIQLTKPQWVVAENVRGLLTIEQGVVFEQVCIDLEREGYEVQPFIIPAVAVNAPHRRDRVWFVAFNTEHDGRYGSKDRKGSSKGSNGYTKGQNEIQQPSRPDRQRDDATNAASERLEGRNGFSTPTKLCSESNRGEKEWGKNWLEVATELCRMDDGLPAELDRLKFTKSAHRRERLKSLGNSIVPSVAIEIMQAIKAQMSYDPT